jgi:hypothetical protein
MYIGYIPGPTARLDERDMAAGNLVRGTEEATWQMSGW